MRGTYFPELVRASSNRQIRMLLERDHLSDDRSVVDTVAPRPLSGAFRDDRRDHGSEPPTTPSRIRLRTAPCRMITHGSRLLVDSDADWRIVKLLTGWRMSAGQNVFM